jgi:hypothetical protein
MYPTKKYFEFYGAPDLLSPLPAWRPTGVKAIGATYLVSNILASLGVNRVLEDAFGSDRSAMIQSIAGYMLCRGNVIERISDWCEGCSLCRPITPQVASLVFSSITNKEIMDFFKAWAARNNSDEFLAYDVTSFSTYAKKIEDAEWGYNRDGDKLAQINIGHYLSYQNGLPIFYVTYPGSIIDKSHMPYMMMYNDELAINNPIFIMDRGFCSTANIQALHADNIRYIIMVDLLHKSAQLAINEVRNDIKSISNKIIPGLFGKTIHSRFYGVRTDMHVFYSHELEINHELSLYQKIELKGKKLDQIKTLTIKEAKNYSNYYDINIKNDGTFTYSMNIKKIDQKSLNNGFYCIISNTKFNINDVNIIYKRRDIIEKNV